MYNIVKSIEIEQRETSVCTFGARLTMTNDTTVYHPQIFLLSYTWLFARLHFAPFFNRPLGRASYNCNVAAIVIIGLFQIDEIKLSLEHSLSRFHDLSQENASTRRA